MRKHCPINGCTTSIPWQATLDYIPLEKVVVNGGNPRQSMDDAALQELAASVKEHGILQPVLVEPVGDTYELVAGHRRVAAAALAGLDQVPAQIRAVDQDRLAAALTENILREDLTPVEEAEALAKLQAETDAGVRELARRLGKGKDWISDRLRLARLPDGVRASVAAGDIDLHTVPKLARLAEATSPKAVETVVARAKREGGGIGYYVETELREHEKRKRIGDETQRLTTAGVRVVEPKKDQYGQLKPPNGAVEISKEGGYWSLKLDPKTHATEPCHAAMVQALYDGRAHVTYLCTDRKRHPKLKTGSERSTGSSDAALKKEREKQRAQREAATARRAFVAGLITGSVSKDAALASVVRGFLEVSQQDVLKIACELLELEPVVTKHSYSTSRNYTKPIADFADKGAAQLQRTALALGLAATEAHMEANYIQWGDRERNHLAYLEAQGYKPSPAERQRLPKKRTSKKAAAA